MGDVLTQRIAFAQQSVVKEKTILGHRESTKPLADGIGVVCAHCVEKQHREQWPQQREQKEEEKESP